MRNDNAAGNASNTVTLPADNTGATGVAPRTAAAYNAAACARECCTPATCEWPECSCPAVVNPAARAA